MKPGVLFRSLFRGCAFCMMFVLIARISDRDSAGQASLAVAVSVTEGVSPAALAHSLRLIRLATDTTAPEPTIIREGSGQRRLLSARRDATRRHLPRSFTLMGYAETATQRFELSPGPVSFHVAHAIDSPFAIFLLDDAGRHLAMLVNTTDSIVAKVNYDVPAAGEYYLHVIGQDAWDISVLSQSRQMVE